MKKHPGETEVLRDYITNVAVTWLTWTFSLDVVFKKSVFLSISITECFLPV